MINDMMDKFCDFCRQSNFHFAIGFLIVVIVGVICGEIVVAMVKPLLIGLLNLLFQEKE